MKLIRLDIRLFVICKVIRDFQLFFRVSLNIFCSLSRGARIKNPYPDPFPSRLTARGRGKCFYEVWLACRLAKPPGGVPTPVTNKPMNYILKMVRM
jgi:hypothetical protein